MADQYFYKEIKEIGEGGRVSGISPLFFLAGLFVFKFCKEKGEDKEGRFFCLLLFSLSSLFNFLQRERRGG